MTTMMMITWRWLTKQCAMLKHDMAIPETSRIVVHSVSCDCQDETSKPKPHHYVIVTILNFSVPLDCRDQSSICIWHSYVAVEIFPDLNLLANTGLNHRANMTSFRDFQDHRPQSFMWLRKDKLVKTWRYSDHKAAHQWGHEITIRARARDHRSVRYSHLLLCLLLFLRHPSHQAVTISS